LSETLRGYPKDLTVAYSRALIQPFRPLGSGSIYKKALPLPDSGQVSVLEASERGWKEPRKR